VKDFLCTRTDWINHGKYPSNLEICQYADGEEKYISIGGIPYIDPVHKAGYRIRRVQNFQPFLLEPSNRDIGYIKGRVFEPPAPPAAQVTLSWVRELQRIEVALQNKLNQDPDAVHAGLIEAMQTKMVDYSSFVKARKSLSIFIRNYAEVTSSSWINLTINFYYVN
jgi:hypothetical protein